MGAISVIILNGCTNHFSTPPLPSQTLAAPPHSHEASTAGQAATMRLSDGEVVTIPPAILSAVQNHQDLSIGQFRAIAEVDDISWTANAVRRASAAHTLSATGSSADHSTNGWDVDGYDSNPNYQSEGYMQFTKTWTRISNEKYMYARIYGSGTCFFGPNSPYFNEGYFADGWSDWEAAGV